MSLDSIFHKAHREGQQYIVASIVAGIGIWTETGVIDSDHIGIRTETGIGIRTEMGNG